ncbi:MAG: hypothetical protein IJN80_04690 [Clostridia bacterium]|nr:hypothetical protein [Clostridia bacterium]
MERLPLGLTHGREQIDEKQKILIEIRIAMRIFPYSKKTKKKSRVFFLY